MAKRKPSKRGKKPTKQAEPGASPTSGVAPPAEHRFTAGDPRINRKGRPSGGLVVREWLNVLLVQELTEQTVRGIARDRRNPMAKRAAAERLLRMIEAPDLADFEPLLRGEKDLGQLRDGGVCTEAVKRFKVRTRVELEKNKKGEDVPVEVTDREIELYDRAGADFDRVLDQTAGRPTQTVEIEEPEKGDLVEDPRYVELYLALGVGRAAWSPAILARYEAGKVPGYPKPGKVT